jgi:hypothetical protein
MAKAILEAVTTTGERRALLARFDTSSRRATAALLDAVRGRALAYKAGYREPVA